MTAIVAWVHRGSILVIGDTATTTVAATSKDSRLNNLMSALGQPEVGDAGHTVERETKIMLSHGCAYAYCGDVATARACGQEIDHSLAGGLSPEMALSRGVASASAHGANFECVFGFRDSSGPRVFGFDSENSLPQELLTPGNPVCSGGSFLHHPAHESLVTLLKGIGTLECTAEQALVSALAAANALSLVNNLTDYAIGGPFIGALVDRQGARWQPNILYLPYRPDLPPEAKDAIHRVLVRVENGLFLTASTMSSDRGIVLRRLRPVLPSQATTLSPKAAPPWHDVEYAALLPRADVHAPLPLRVAPLGANTVLKIEKDRNWLRTDLADLLRRPVDEAEDEPPCLAWTAWIEPTT